MFKRNINPAKLMQKPVPSRETHAFAIKAQYMMLLTDVIMKARPDYNRDAVLKELFKIVNKDQIFNRREILELFKVGI